MSILYVDAAMTGRGDTTALQVVEIGGLRHMDGNLLYGEEMTVGRQSEEVSWIDIDLVLAYQLTLRCPLIEVACAFK